MRYIAGDTTFLFSHNDTTTVIRNLIIVLARAENWFNKRNLKINENKSANVQFINKKVTTTHVIINNIEIPIRTSVKYLGVYFDRRLKYRYRIQTKKSKLDMSIKKLLLVNW